MAICAAIAVSPGLSREGDLLAGQAAVHHVDVGQRPDESVSVGARAIIASQSPASSWLATERMSSTDLTAGRGAGLRASACSDTS